MICPALAWLVMRLAVYGGPEDVTVLEHHGTEVTADADRNRLTVHLELRMSQDRLLHLARRIECIVDCGERGHHFVTHGLDDSAVMLLRRGAHDVDADRHHVARLLIAHLLVKLGAADDVGEQNGEFDILGHGYAF